MGIKQIVVVDDDDGARFIMEKYLGAEPGYKTTLLESGEKLLDYLKVKTPDLVLLDIDMPGMSGIETFEKMRSNKSWAGIPVIFLTGMEDRNTVLKCIGRGADAYLVKPVLKKKLIEKIDEILKKYDDFKSNKTILMIDDDVAFLRIAKVKLSQYYKVLTVDSAKTALEYLSNHKVDLIITDYVMPLYDGRSVLNILKRRDCTHDIPVIIASGVVRDEIVAACMQAPPDGIVSKPIDMNELLSMIQTLLERKRR
ncbi:MAG: response regulator [Wujia sp.]